MTAFIQFVVFVSMLGCIVMWLRSGEKYGN
jgi:hypothetical protein